MTARAWLAAPDRQGARSAGHRATRKINGRSSGLASDDLLAQRLVGLVRFHLGQPLVQRVEAALREIGRNMPRIYKETSEGGLATTPTGLQFRPEKAKNRLPIIK